MARSYTAPKASNDALWHSTLDSEDLHDPESANELMCISSMDVTTSVCCTIAAASKAVGRGAQPRLYHSQANRAAKAALPKHDKPRTAPRIVLLRRGWSLIAASGGRSQSAYASQTRTYPYHVRPYYFAVGE